MTFAKYQPASTGANSRHLRDRVGYDDADKVKHVVLNSRKLQLQDLRCGVVRSRGSSQFGAEPYKIARFRPKVICQFIRPIPRHRRAVLRPFHKLNLEGSLRSGG
ncbi:MAG: hypothetical protein JWM11_3760 [Planctomycetaceae bacterium]|nr:hypothetical protein [Planctomycetaceae bacterium]